MNHSFQLPAALLLLCGATLAPVALLSENKAATPAEKAAHHEKLFAAADTDGVGRVSEQEFVDFELRRRFEKADVNKDGRLSKAEFLASVKSGSEHRNAKAEWKIINGGKGYVTIEDESHDEPLVKELHAEFRKLDKNGQGYLTTAEWPNLGR